MVAIVLDMLPDTDIDNEKILIQEAMCSYSDEKRNNDRGDHDDDSTCNSNDTNECIEMFLGLNKNTIKLIDMKEVNFDEVEDDDDDVRNLDCLNKEEQHDVNEIRKVINTNNHPHRDSMIEGIVEGNGSSEIATNNENDNFHSPLQVLSWFQCAYLTPTTTGNSISAAITGSPELQQPLQHCVRIVYDPARQYYSLVATATPPATDSHRQMFIPKGTVLYTERPLFATQIPSSYHNNNKKIVEYQNSSTLLLAQQNDINETQSVATTMADHEYYKVRACQFCFRSLEPISSCYDCCNTSSTCEDKSRSRTPSDPSLLLPLQYLYPVPDFSFPEATSANDREDDDRQRHQLTYRKDRHGRILCALCRSYFCSLQCYNRMIHQYGTCCSFRQLLHSYSSSNSTPTRTYTSSTNANHISDTTVRCSDIRNKNAAEDLYEDDADPLWEAMQQPAIALAVRMFVATLHQHRSARTGSKYTYANVSTDSMSSIPSIVDGLCGTAADLQLLELGIPIRMNANNNEELEAASPISRSVQYTVEPIYEMLVSLHSISKVEQTQEFSLAYFMSLCSKSARNGFGVRPQSPFQSYYAGIVRTSLYRGSTQHVKFQNQIANALLGCATSDAQFQRGMDRMIDDRVCPEVVALFPLTSRINHSCSPNAEVRSQQYVDGTIDVVSIKDIKIGEEITISYIYGSGGSRRNSSSSITNATTQRQRNHKTTHRRQLELYAKYLFHCGCVLCKNGETL